MENIYEVMKKYGEMMASQEYTVGDAAKMILQTEEGVFATRDGADVGNLIKSDVVKLNMKSWPILKSGMKAIVYSQTPSCQKCLRDAKPFRACLDDMAQIIGPAAYIVDGRDGNNRMGKSLIKALRHNAGCFVLRGVNSKGHGVGYTLTMGRNLYEAVVAMTVLEKSAEVFLLAEKLGGAQPISKREAKLMRSIYKRKYSKAEEQLKTAEVK